jgi:hypothetical protein
MSVHALRKPREPQSTAAMLRELIDQHDSAEAIVRRTRELIRPLARKWADEKPDGVNQRQFTMPTIDQLRRELGDA